MTNHDRNDELRARLVEYLAGCAEDPAAIERLLEGDEGARAELARAEAELALFRDAASASDFDADALELEPPAELRPVRSFRALKRAVAAALLLVPAGLWGLWGLEARDVAREERSGLEVTVSAPETITPGAPVRVRVAAVDVARREVEAALAWVGRDADGNELFRGERSFAGAMDLDLEGSLALRSVALTVEREGLIREREVDLVVAEPRPLVHLSQDKPAYRPGETVHLRALCLDRLSYEPLDGRAHLELRDAKDAVVQETWQRLERGVAAWSWTIPANAAGGNYTFAFRDRGDEFDAEALEFLVRDYQPPRLATEVDLDRHTYAPGETVVAELAVTRVEGGAADGAQVRAACVVDGEEVAAEELVLDAAGAGFATFDLPREVARGEGRVVVRVEHGGTVETRVEPFVVPTGAVDVAFFPEGGELVAGLAGRVYVECTDSLGRPTSVRGRVVDDRGTTVARVETELLGWGRFELVPEAGRSYALEFDEPTSASLPLPEGRASGVALRSLADSTGAGRAVRLQLDVARDTDHVVGLFCRGVLVAHEVVRGGGRHVVELAPDEGLAGVLRATVFDAELTPVAERLVHREGARRVAVEVEPERSTLLPGEAQTLTVRTTDERGAAVPAVLGLAVSDHAVRAMRGEERVGLVDQAWLFADVEDLEDTAGFFPEDEARAFHVDLLLGTRGWRRFGWRDAKALVEEHGEPARRLFMREGRADRIAVFADGGDSRRRLYDARQEQRRWGGIAGFGSFVAVVVALVWLTAFLLKFALRDRPVVRWASAVLLVGVFGFAFVRSTMPRDGMVASAALEVADFAPGADLVESEEALLEDEPFLADSAFDSVVFNSVIALGRGVAPGSLPAGGPGFSGPGAAGPGASFGAPVEGWSGPVDGPGDVERLRGLGYLGGPGPADEFRGEPLVKAEEAFVDEAGRQGLADFLSDKRRLKPRGSVARVYAHRHPGGGARTDFTETLFWHPLLVTDERGEATVRFDTSDRVTTWDVAVDAHGAGRIGQGRAAFEAVQPFTLEAKLPVELSQGDRVDLPVALRTGATGVTSATFGAQLAGPVVARGDVPAEVALERGAARVFLPLEVTEGTGDLTLAMGGEAAGWRDRVGRTIRVAPRGFPTRWSHAGRVTDARDFEVAVPADPVPGTLVATLALYPSPLADLLDGVEGILREPHGCFEQTSSSHYPNLLALNFLDASGADEPVARARAMALVEQGYDRLVSFECSKRGYEWFGKDPGHEALTAYGLFEFTDQHAVLPVDEEMLARTRGWLLAARDGEGGFRRPSGGYHSWDAAPEVVDAFVLCALLESGEDPDEWAPELDLCEERTRATDDPYRLALGARALHLGGRAAAADAARDALKRCQEPDGSLPGASTTVTSSRGTNLLVETAALAVLAWLDDPEDAAHVDRAVAWLVERRSGGTFGATQATVQALRALVGYALDRRRVANDGTVVVRVDGRPVGELAFLAGRNEAMRFDLGEFLGAGTHEVALELTGDNDFPFEFTLEHFAEVPASVPDAPLELSATLAEGTVEEGRTVRLDVELVNRRAEPVMMPLAIVGLPAGLEAPTEVLDDLEEAGRFAHWGLRGRDLVLYFAGLEASAVARVSVDLVAVLPGTTRGPASRAYPYYEDDRRTWIEPLEVVVSRAE